MGYEWAQGYLLFPLHLLKENMLLFIKNMVCIRCKIIVKDEIKRLGWHYTKVELGMADIVENLSKEELLQLDRALQKSGLALIDSKKSILIEKIKHVVIELIHYTDEPSNITFSDYLSDKLQYDYTYLSNLFTEVHGSTLEHYIIAHKIEKVKEMLVYQGLSLTEIAEKMGYSSVAHLSAQFKKTTGLTPTHFMKLKEKRWNGHEDL
jgi:YesN/AraC family two-component response regulator